jgi:hypothetical protein
MLISGTSVAAFVLGCWLGYADAPSEQTQATAVMSRLTQNDQHVQSVVEPIAILKPKEVSPGDDANLLFAGDVSFGGDYESRVGGNHSWALGQLPELRQADVSMLNLDTPLTQANQVLPGKQSYTKAAPDRVSVLSQGGVDLVNLANNRTMDYQSAGLAETITTLNQAGIATVGAGQNSAEARRPVVMDVKGQKIAYLSYYDSDLHAATAQQAGTNPRRNDRIAADIRAIRSQVNWVVVNYHWGEEMAKYPGDWQIDLARFTIDQGADLVVGHHSKVLQGAEIYKGRPIAYSLGNFIFSGQTPAPGVSDYDTAVLKVGLKDQQMRVEFLPVEVRNFQARVVKDPRGEQILNRIKDVSDIFDEPMSGPMIFDAQTNTATPLKSGGQPKSDSPSGEPSPEPEATEPVDDPTAQPNPVSPDDAQPWNQNTFTDPQQDPADRQGNAAAPEVAPKQLELTLPTQSVPLEPTKRRYASAQPLTQPLSANAVTSMLSLEVQPPLR